MKNFSFTAKMYFAPEQVNAVEKSSADVSAVEAKIAQAKQLYDSRANLSAGEIVNKDREYRRSNEFKKILLEIQKMNEADRHALDQKMWAQLSEL